MVYYYVEQASDGHLTSDEEYYDLLTFLSKLENFVSLLNSSGRTLFVKLSGFMIKKASPLGHQLMISSYRPHSNMYMSLDGMNE